ncbi:hypothetical protein RB195_026504 [Necator americanus]|uniref:Uncharacterized protein n=1 Tax=Necator americanus TaxID=51031 RepID=A0ABR1EX81_NECAM
METRHKCTSQSYCVSVKSRNGLVQRSCDGNSMAHISLCALSPPRRRVTNSDFIYGSSGGTSIHPSARLPRKLSQFSDNEKSGILRAGRIQRRRTSRTKLGAFKATICPLTFFGH